MQPVAVVKMYARHIQAKCSMTIEADFFLIIISWQLLFLNFFCQKTVPALLAAFLQLLFFRPSDLPYIIDNSILTHTLSWRYCLRKDFKHFVVEQIIWLANFLESKKRLYCPLNVFRTTTILYLQ